jgi:hypothetical protein
MPSGRTDRPGSSLPLRYGRRGTPYTLTRHDLSLLYRRAGDACEVTGLPFEHDPFAGSLYRPFAPSLDRINAAQGYSLGNVRLVAVIVNAALNQWGDAAFWKMVDAAAGRQRGTPRFEATRENVYNQHGDQREAQFHIIALINIVYFS